MLYQQMYMETKTYQVEEVGVGIQALAVGIIFAGIEYILGLKIQNNKITLNPCVPNEWEEYFIQYKYEESIYNIKVKNTNGTNEIQKIIFNGQETLEKEIKLQDNKKINDIEIII